jgi:putative ABC transport system substrate-binding protein
VLGEVPAALGRGRRQRALAEQHERLAELLRLTLRIVGDRWMSTVTRRALLTSAAAFVVAPITSEAQPHQAKPKVLFVAVSRLPEYEASFDSTLRSLGWEEGSNVLMERHYIRSGQAPSEVAAWAVRRIPDIIVVPSAGIATAVRRETTSIPIVVIAAGELVGTGLAESVARPGGNVTGTQIIQRDLMGKRLELLKELLPRLTRVAAVQEAATVPAKMRADGRIAFEAPTRALRLEPIWYEPRSVEEFDDCFRTMVHRKTDAVIVLGSPFMLLHARLLAELAAKYRVPATYETKDWVQVGGLMSLGVDFVEIFVRAAAFVDKVLRGAKPADLPIEQPTKFQFIINLKTAKALGLTIPPSLLARADQVIE